MKHDKCSLEGCERPARRAGWCGMHHQRLLKAGTPGEVEARRLAAGTRDTCIICEEPMVGRGMCKKHYQKWYWHGDPLWEKPPPAGRNPNKKKEEQQRWREKVRNNPELLERKRKYAREWAKKKHIRLRQENPNYEHPSLALRRRKARFLQGYKLMMGCADCGYDLHPAALEFDHVFGKKSEKARQLSSLGWSDIRAELKKCEVVCSNCHHIRSYENLLDHGHAAGALAKEVA